MRILALLAISTILLACSSVESPLLAKAITCESGATLPNGRLTGGEEYLRKAAHDPASISVASCAVEAAGGTHAESEFIVRCIARGKNRVGALVAARVDFEVTKSCRIVAAGGAHLPCGEWQKDEDGEAYRSVCVEELPFLDEELFGVGK